MAAVCDREHPDDERRIQMSQTHNDQCTVRSDDAVILREPVRIDTMLTGPVVHRR